MTPRVASGETLSLDAVGRVFRRESRRPSTLKQSLLDGLRGRLRREDRFEALSGITATFRRGDIVGLCGSNGAGKSTLLKLIAGILPPTSGSIVVRGRIAALLELGAGFLPELTGRENIRLGAALLGLEPGQIRRRQPAIEAFAGLGDFIDAPVRTYSSGMYMRLGFAVACHVDAEILLLDEVLSVGDLEFQRQCAGWLDGLRIAARDGSGPTVIMASHHLPTLGHYCRRVLHLERGRVVDDGPATEVIDRYQRGAPGPRAAASGGAR